MYLDPFHVPSMSADQLSSQEAALIHFRQYQLPVFWSTRGLLLLHWSRQIGKSFTLAAWAAHRVGTNPGRLVTVLSNSKSNGVEFIHKCAEVCALMRLAFEHVDLSAGDKIENMRMEIRIRISGKTGRIIVLAANPRTARGFSGDLILDEFAFHEDSAAIWDAAEPIISSQSGLPLQDREHRETGGSTCSTGWQTNPRPMPSPASAGARHGAWESRFTTPATRQEIAPEQARAVRAGQGKL